MQFANLFPKNRSTVITFYSGAFSSSAVLFVLLKYTYDAGVSFGTTCSAMVVAALLMLPVTFFLLPRDRVREPEPAADSAEIMSKKYSKGNLALVSSTMITLEKFKALESPIAGRKGIVNAVMEVEDEIALDDCESTTSSEEVIIRKRSGQGEADRDTEIRSTTPFTGKTIILPLSSLKMSSVGVNKATCAAVRGSSCKVDHVDCSKASQEANSNNNNSSSRHEENCDERPPSCSPSSSGSSRSSADSEDRIPLSQSLFSIPFSLHQWWYSWLITYMIMYVGTMNLWLDRVTDDR